MMRIELAALLDNDDEWFNMPPILRKMFRLMSEEDENSQRLIDALRLEQKETNTLVRRLFQKQTNMEIDAVKNAMMINGKLRGDENYKIVDDMKNLKKKVSKNQDDLKHLEEMIKSLPSEDLIISRIDSSLAESIVSIDSKIEAAITQSDAQKVLVNNAIVKANELTESINCLKQGHMQTDKLNLEHNSRVVDLEKKVNNLLESSLECEELGRKLSRLSKEFSDYESVSEKRFKSMFNSFAKIDTLCENQRTMTDDLMQRCAADTVEKCSLLRAEMHRITTDAHDFMSSAITRIRKDIEGLQDGVQSLRKSANENDDSIEKIQAAMGVMNRQVARVESVLDKLEGQHITLSNALDERRKSESDQFHALAQVENRMSNEITCLKEQTAQVDARVGEVRAFCEKATDTLRHDIEKLQNSIYELSDEQLRVANQNERLHKLVGGVSNAMDNLEVAMARRCAASQSAEERQRFFAENEEREKVLGLCEHLRKTLIDTNKAIHREMDERQTSVEGLDKQLKAAILKISNLEDTISTATQRMEYYHQNHSTWKSWQEKALEEVSPALVEMEAIKRRIVLLESKISDVNSDIINNKTDMPVRLLGESLDEVRNHVLDFPRRFSSFEKRFTALTSDVHRIEDQIQDSESLTARLGHDLTRVLESIVDSGSAVARMQTLTDARFEELNTKIVNLEQRMKRSALAILPSSEPLSINIEKYLHEWRLRMEEALSANQQALTMRVDKLEELVQSVSNTEASRDLKACEIAVPTEIDTKCVASYDANTGNMADNDEGYPNTLEYLTREIQNLWKALHTIRSPDFEHPGSSTLSPPKDEGQQCLSIEALPHSLHDTTEIEKVVDACVQSSLLTLATNLGADLRESVGKQCDLVNKRHAERTGKLESALEIMQNSLDGLQDRLDARDTKLVANSKDQQGRLDAVESVLMDFSRVHKQLVDDVDSVKENLRSFESERVKQKIKSPEETQIQPCDGINGDLTHLGVKTKQLEEDAQSLPLMGMPFSQSLSSSITMKGADLQTEEALLEFLGRETALLEERMNAAFCTKVFLEERLEALQNSLVDLLACKADKRGVDAKIDEFHELIMEEVSIQFRELRNGVMNIMAEKVSLNELQKILERDAFEFE